MTIEMFDMDIPFLMMTDVNADGKDFVRIKSQPDRDERDEDYDICLDASQCREMSRALAFLATELDNYEKNDTV